MRALCRLVDVGLATMGERDTGNVACGTGRGVKEYKACFRPLSRLLTLRFVFNLPSTCDLWSALVSASCASIRVLSSSVSRSTVILFVAGRPHLPEARPLRPAMTTIAVPMKMYASPDGEATETIGRFPAVMFRLGKTRAGIQLLEAISSGSPGVMALAGGAEPVLGTVDYPHLRLYLCVSPRVRWSCLVQS